MTKRISKWSSYPEGFRKEVVEQVLSGKMSSNQAHQHCTIRNTEQKRKNQTSSSVNTLPVIKPLGSIDFNSTDFSSLTCRPLEGMRSFR